MKIITRKEAKEKGLKRYFTGKACKNGHIAERLVCNKTCVECERIRKAKKKVETKVTVVSVPKKQIRVVRFEVSGQNRIGRGRKKYQPRILSDQVVTL